MRLKLFEEWINEVHSEEFEQKIAELAPKIEKLLPREIGDFHSIRCRMVHSDWGYDYGSPSGDNRKAVVLGTITQTIRKPFKKTEIKERNVLFGTLADPQWYVPAEIDSRSTNAYVKAIEAAVNAVMEVIPDVEIDIEYVKKNAWFMQKYPTYKGRGEILGTELNLAE